MTTKTRANPTSNGTLMNGLRDNPATKRLADEAKNLVDAQVGRITSRVGNGIASTVDKLTDIGETGEIPMVGEAVKRVASGQNPVAAAVGTAKTGVASKVKQLFSKNGKGSGGGSRKSVNIEEQMDIGVPISVAYNQWTQFQDFSRFTKGVQSVEQKSETETNWRAKVFKSTRTWTATIREQVPDRRIEWTSEGAKGSTRGVVTFHALGDDLTRVLLALEYFPSGFFEKTGNIWRAPGRRVRLDLKSFRKFIMFENEPTGEWRGEIRDGEVVSGPEDSEEEPEERERDQFDDEEPEELEDSNSDEDEDEDEEPEELEDSDEDEEPEDSGEDEEPKARSGNGRGTRRRTPARAGSRGGSGRGTGNGRDR